MSNVIQFRRAKTTTPLPPVDLSVLPADQDYTEVECFYESEWARLSIVTADPGMGSTLYLVVHSNTGARPRCIIQWSGEESLRIGSDGMRAVAQIAAMAIAHADELRTSGDLADSG